jgi:DNA-directed RNA polymerase specialized sigma24 family protein
VSPTSEQRAQVLYLHQVEGVSIVVIAVMTGLSRSAVSRVLQQPRRQDAPAVEKAAAMRPSSKGRVERETPLVHAHLLRKVTS